MGMQVALIPVIEIGYANQGVELPDKWPCWQYPAIWDRYREESHSKAGFKTPLIPFQPGLPLYRLADIAEESLVKLTKDHTEDLRNGVYGRAHASAFFGGYILEVEGEAKFYPQCCGDLSDIVYWEKLSNETVSAYNGHPAPDVNIEGHIIQFDFSEEKQDEAFQPTPSSSSLLIETDALKTAVEKVAIELEDLSQRLIAINFRENLKIENIDQLLIWADNVHD